MGHQVAPASGPLDRLACLGENTFELFVQFITVGDDRHAGVRVVFQNPLGQQHHHDAFAAALRVPDDAALAFVYVLLGSFGAEILVHARQLFHSAVKEHEVVRQLDQPRLVAHLQQILVQLEVGVVLFVLLPLEEMLLFGTNRAVLQALRVVARKDELHGAEEPGVELGPLVGNVLPDAVANRNAAVLEFQHAHGDAIHIQHEVGPPFEVTAERDFLGDGEVVQCWFFPVNQMDGFGNLARFDLHRHTIAEQIVNSLVIPVEASTVVIGLGAEIVQGFVDLRSVTTFGERGREQAFPMLLLPSRFTPVTQVAIAEFIAE